MSFKPSLHSTLALAPLAVLFVLLGNWQLERAAEKRILEDQFHHPPVIESGASLVELPLFARVGIDGTYDPKRHLLLDNQVEGGRAGVHVLTPFTTLNDETILVDRGWLPLLPDRTMPSISSPTAAIRIEGLLGPEPMVGRQLGDDDRLSPDEWPQLVTYYNRDRIDEALGLKLPTSIIWLDVNDPSGFGAREWSPVQMGSDRHTGYAVQWYALALTALIAWLALGIRRGRTA